MSAKNSWRSIVKHTVLVLAAALTFWAGLAHAVTPYTWNGAVTGGTWSTAYTNWDGASGTPWDVTNGTSNIANFETPSLNATVIGAVYTNGIAFSAAGTLSGGTINLAGMTPTIATTNDGTISSVLDGTSGLTKNGTGTLTLTALQSYSGPTVIAGGTLKLLKPQPASESIGIQFQGGGAAIGTNWNGVVSMTNWNSFSGNSLDISPPLKDSTGKTGMATASFTAPGAWNTGSSTPLLDGYLDNSLTGMAENVTISKIPYSTYDVYAYFGSDTDGRPGSVQLGAGVTYYYTTRGVVSDYALTTGTTGSASASANYAVWRGVTGASFTVNQYRGTSDGNNNSGLHGIEIVNATPAPAANLLPATTALSIDANTTLDLAGASQQVASLSDSSLGGGSIINSSTGATSVLTLSPTGGSTTFSGGILSGGSNGTIGLVKADNGTQVLSSRNTYSGGTTISGGTLQLGNSAALGAATGGLTVNSGVLDVQAYNLTVGSLGGAGGTILNNSSGSATLTVNMPSGATTYSGVLADGLGRLALTKNGAGRLILTGPNTFSGNTLIGSGTLQLGAASGNATLALQNSTLDTTGIGTLSFGNMTSGTLGGLTGGGALVLSNTASQAVAMSVGNNNTNTIYSGILSGSGALTKTGTGMLSLTGPNTYTGGTTIGGGTLSVGSGGSGASIGMTSGVALSNNANLTFNHADPVTWNKAITGIGSLTKTGTGTLTLAASQSYSGPTVITDGTLKLVGKQSASGSIGIQFQGGGAAIGTNSNGVVSMTNWNSFTESSLDVSTPLKDSTGNTGMATLASFTAPGAWNTGSSTPLLDGYLDSSYVGAAENVKISNVPYPTYDVYAYFGAEVDGHTGSVQLGSGVNYYYKTLGKVNNYALTTGTTGSASTLANYAVWRGVTEASFTVNQYRISDDFYNSSGLHGIEIVNATPAPAANLLPTTTTLSIDANATLDLGGASQQVASLSDSSLGGGSIINSSTDATSILTLSLTGGSTTFSGGILSGGSNGMIGLVKAGNGTLMLSGTNTYSGGTTVAAGALIVTNSYSLPDGHSLIVGAGGVLIFDPSAAFGSQIVGGASEATLAVAVPEPGTLALLITGLVVGFGLRRKRKS